MRWRDVPGYEGRYQVSDTGLVYSLLTDKCLAQHERGRGRSNGYLSVALRKNGAQRSFQVHVLVATVFVRNPRLCKTVNHEDFDRVNNHWRNLTWMTQLENVRHAVTHGRHVRTFRPVACYLGKFELQRFESAKQASKVVGVGYSTIRRGVTGRTSKRPYLTWKYL